MKIAFLLMIACLWACNLKSQNSEVVVNGVLENYKGEKVYFEICGQDTTIVIKLDDKGVFSAHLPLKEAGYVRMANGKAAFPLYLKPGEIVGVTMDVKKVSEGDYFSVKFKKKANPETRMMADYYEKQWFPETQEMFVLPPVDYKQKMDSVVRYNDDIITSFVKKNPCDPGFVELFRLQVKVPLAASYFYYPMYHGLLNKQDQSPVPADFNIFDKTLPKNDLNIYTKIYRYKIYEISYWNNLLGTKLGALIQEPEKFVNAYIDELNNLQLNQQIRDDIGNSFVAQYHDKLPEEALAVLKSRYKEMVENPAYQQRIEKIFNGM